MVRKKTSKGRGFSFGDMPKVHLKKSAPTRAHDPSERFRNPRQVFEALIDALKAGDGDAFKEILAAYLDLTNKDEFARVSGIPRRTLFRMLSANGNPTLDNITKVVSALRKVV